METSSRRSLSGDPLPQNSCVRYLVCELTEEDMSQRLVKGHGCIEIDKPGILSQEYLDGLYSRRDNWQVALAQTQSDFEAEGSEEQEVDPDEADVPALMAQIKCLQSQVRLLGGVPATTLPSVLCRFLCS